MKEYTNVYVFLTYNLYQVLTTPLRPLVIHNEDVPAMGL